MTTEYWLQKKTIGGWSHVTYYSDELEARTNLDKVAIPNNGYSWRLVKAEVIEERMLEEVVEVASMPLDIEATKAKAALWGKSIQDAPTGWGATPAASGWDKPAVINPILNTGLSSGDGRGAKAGSICLMHHQMKKRMRAMPDELDMLLSQGWERGGPRTQFRS